MKKFLFRNRKEFLKSIFLLLLCIPFSGNAQRLLTADFGSYTLGNLVGQESWTQQLSGNSLVIVDNDDGPMTYPGFQAIVTDNKSVLFQTSGEDIYKTFTSTNSNVYFSALIKLSEVNTGNTFLTLGMDGTLTNARARLWAKKSANEKIQFGVSKTTNSQTSSDPTNVVKWDDNEYELNTTILVVVKYSFNTGDKNDVVSLFVNPIISEIEPSPVVTSTDQSGTDATSMTAIIIYQGTSALSPAGKISSLRVSKSWSGLFYDIWKGRTTTTNASSWTLASNWESGVAPTSTASVIIPALGSNYSYPTLTATTTVNDITFKHGAQIGRPDLLNYEKAFFELDYTKDNMTDRWHMLSMPLKGVVLGDLAFGGAPSVFLRKFDASVTDDGSWMKGNWSAYQTSNTVPFAPAEGFISWVNGSSDKDGTGNLEKIGGILRLPSFENTGENGINRGNPYHSYNKETNTSTFSYFEGNETDEISRDGAHRFIFESASYSSITFGTGGLALIGNPYPSSLDFDAFQTINSAIKNTYQIWTGTEFHTYNGEVNNTLDKYIAPMQSFIVERKDGISDLFFTPSFNAETMAVARPTTSSSQLRASENVADKLEITASYGNKATHTLVANREGGSSTFGNKDSRKLMLGISSIPEVYTVKESENGNVGVGVNIINMDNILIPLALATSHEGETSFTFKGMDTYNAQITLIDRAENNKRIPLTGNSHEYKFNYIPKKINDRIVADEDRFVIELAPANATGLNSPTDQTLVYSKDKTIHLVNSSAGSIKRVFVYNTQGGLVYANGNVVAASYKIDAGNLPEACIVKIVTDKGVKNVKVLVK